MTNELSVQLPDDAVKTLAAVDDLVSKLAFAEQKLEHGYAQLGFLLTEVSEKNYWRGGYKSFSEYIAQLGDKFNLGRTSLYSYLGTVRELKEHVSESDLTEMGIGKAQELARAVKTSGAAPSPQIIQEAVKSSVSVKDVRKLLVDAKQVGEMPDGVWLDLDFSGYATADQKELILAALRAADHTDPVIQPTMKPSARNIERLTRLAMEYINAHPEEE
jgi:hypothetical protein